MEYRVLDDRLTLKEILSMGEGYCVHVAQYSY